MSSNWLKLDDRLITTPVSSNTTTSSSGNHKYTSFSASSSSSSLLSASSTSSIRPASTLLLAEKTSNSFSSNHLISSSSSPLPRMPTGRPEFHVPHLHLDVLNHSSLSLLRPSSPAHMHGVPTTAVVNTCTESASATRSDQTMSPEITTHNDKVLAPSSFLRRYLRMIHRRDNESTQSSLSRQSSRCSSPCVDSRKEQQVADRDLPSLSSTRHLDEPTVLSQGGPAIASLERFINVERRGRSLSEQLRQDAQRHELKEDCFTRTNSPQKEMPRAIPSPLSSFKLTSQLQTQRRQSSQDSLNNTHWNNDKLLVMTDPALVDAAVGRTLTGELPSPCLSQASTMSTVSSPICMDTVSFDSNRSSANSSALKRESSRSRPVFIMQTPPVSGERRPFTSNNNNNNGQLHHDPHALRSKARTITGHRRQFSAQPSHPQPIRAMSMYSGGLSMPRVTAASYDQLPYSPAVSFLSMFAQSTCRPTEEEEEMLREDEAGDEVGGYVLGRELSRGHFSTVREAYHIEETKVKIGPVVVKIVRRGDISLEAFRRGADNKTVDSTACAPSRSDTDSSAIETTEEAMRRELQIWRRLQHPNILPLLDFFESPMALYAVSPRCSKGSLYHALCRSRRGELGDTPGGLPLDKARQIIAQLASAIRYLHYDAAVAHGDLKLENLIDFGLSRELFEDTSSASQQQQTTAPPQHNCSTAAGSLPYCAPEIIRGGQLITPASDCWAFGVMVYTLLVGKLPFQDAYEPRMIFKIIQADYELPASEEESDDTNGGFCSAADWGMMGGSSDYDESSSSTCKLPSAAIDIIRNLLCVTQNSDGMHVVSLHVIGLKRLMCCKLSI
ncbi:kinase-like domain-containing protein [Syncephalis fuscata]|nr:kinase-like domain-containing protein [Syncephalis fuscata]